jgi:superfamily II DNA or RNA helicase
VNPQYVPRDYGEAAIKAVLDEFRRVRSTLAILATGTGKTEIYLQIAERLLNENPGKRCLVVAHREELVTQPAKRWRRNIGKWPAIEMGELRSEIVVENDLFDGAGSDGRLVIASIQTLNAGKRCRNCTAECQNCSGVGMIVTSCEKCGGLGRGEGWETDFSRNCLECSGSGQARSRCSECQGEGWICIEDDCAVCFEHFIRRMQKFDPEDFDLLIFDEAHHAVADTYTRIIRYFRQRNPEIRVLGLTATADRADEVAMGKVFESVAYEYNLPQPILDGWLTPIDQQFVLVEDLNLANVRTTAGDFNSGELEREMLAEKVLHKVTTPLVEIACGLAPGTIDLLVRQNRLAELPGLCTKHEQTLVHAVDVAHAERMTEIINRYLPGSALCIIGTTPKNIRRDGLKRFAEGEYQFLLSCGVFLEGTDLPNLPIVGMARPTKSRALYSQMLGRGLRPLTGLVDDPTLTAEERVERIKNSAKPKCTVIDFVGNSGRHKLICSVDILGGELPDELVEGVIRKVAKNGQLVDILRALDEEKARQEEERRTRALRESQERAQKQEEAKRRATERRSGLVAGVSYTTQQINPFDVLDVAPKREPGWHRGRKPTEAMKELLRRSKVPFTEETSFWEARLLIEEIIRRRKEGLCTYAQAKWLQAKGYSPNTKFDECRKIMDGWANNGWKRPP